MDSFSLQEKNHFDNEKKSEKEKSNNFFINHRFSIGLILRFAIVFITDLLEFKGHLNYQDIDYLVFTDGARHILNSESPYKRETFRYSPIMAYFMIPNILIHRSFGKYLFCLFDIAIGVLIEIILYKQINGNNSYSKPKSSEIKIKEENSIVYILNEGNYYRESIFHIFNPLAIAISTRGSSDSLTVFIILYIIYLIEYKQLFLSGILFGFIIHFRLYPIIYSGAFFLYITYLSYKEQNKLKESIEKTNESMQKTIFNKIWYMFKKMNFFIKFVLNNLTCTNSIIFTFSSISTFLILNLIFYYLYNEEYLNEALLYHFIRKDHRHNFSIYNYLIYLTYNSNLAKVVSLISFLPQMILIGSITLAYNSCIKHSLTLLTYIFVHFNKVITAQYFIWYFSLFPLILNNNFFKERKNIILGILWLVFELLWNFYANRLEYKRVNVFLPMFLVEVLFFFVNIVIIGHIIKGEKKVI